MKSFANAILLLILLPLVSIAASDAQGQTMGETTATQHVTEADFHWQQLHEDIEKAFSERDFTGAGKLIDEGMDEVRTRGYGWTDVHTRKTYQSLQKMYVTAVQLQQLGELKQAELAFNESIRILDKAISYDAASSAAICRIPISQTNDQRANYELYEQVLNIQKNWRQEKKFPQALSSHTNQCRSDISRLNGNLRELGRLYQSQKRYAEAEATFNRELAVAEAWHESFTITYVLNLLAGLYQEQGKYADAESVLKRSISLRWKGDPNLPATISMLERVYQLEGKRIKAALARSKAAHIKASQEADAQARAWVLKKAMQWIHD